MVYNLLTTNDNIHKHLQASMASMPDEQLHPCNSLASSAYTIRIMRSTWSVSD